MGQNVLMEFIASHASVSLVSMENFVKIILMNASEIRAVEMENASMESIVILVSVKLDTQVIYAISTMMIVLITHVKTDSVSTISTTISANAIRVGLVKIATRIFDAIQTLVSTELHAYQRLTDPILPAIVRDIGRDLYVQMVVGLNK